jgi:hypothetical protein
MRVPPYQPRPPKLGDGPDTEKMKVPRKPSTIVQAALVGGLMFLALFLCDLLGLF